MKRLINKSLIAIIACVCLGIVPSFAAKTDYELKPGSFVGISISDDFETTVVEGSACRAKMSVEEAYKDYVKVDVKNSILTISVDEKKLPADVKKQFRGSNKPTLRVTVVMPERSLSSITLDDESKLVEVDHSVINTSALYMLLKGNSLTKDFTCETAALTLNLEGKAKAFINTVSESIKVTAAGNSDLELDQQSVDTELTLSGSTDIKLTGKVDSLMTVTSKGGAKSDIAGETTHAVFTVSGTSSVNALDLVCDDAEVKMSGLCSLKEAASKSLILDVVNGANFTFKNTPAITITNIKLSTVTPYAK